jgi:hypothetical protein
VPVSVVRGAILGMAVTLTLPSLFTCQRDSARDDGKAPIPNTARVPATLSFLADFDDEGIVERAVPTDSAPGPYVLEGEIYADAPSVVAVIAPGTRTAANAGLLTLNGENTNIHVRYEGTRFYAPVHALARSLDAYAHTDPTGRQVTLWPSARLCEYRERADTAAPVYRGASSEGLFAQCRK